MLKGLHTALITPFTQNGQLDEAGLRHLIRRQLHHKVDGIVLLGTTGETPTLTVPEKERIMSIGAEEIKDKALFMVGTGSYSTEQTIANTRLAKEMGADVALVVTPYYNKPTQEGLYRHFHTLCESVDLPICIYNIQGRTGQNLQPDTLKRIAACTNLVGLKEASGNFAQFDDMIDMFRGYPLSILAGDDALALPAIALGAHGLISVASNLMPQLLKDLVHTCLKGDFEQARQFHALLTPFFRAVFIETNPIPIKTAMDMCGLAAGPCRLPLCDLLPENRAKLEAIMRPLKEGLVLCQT